MKLGQKSLKEEVNTRKKQNAFAVRWYHFFNLKNVKNTHEGETTLSMGVLHVLLNCKNGTKSRNASPFT